MSLDFYIRYATRSLRRGGQRTLLAILCIAFGVMTLIALQTPAALLNSALEQGSSVTLGADFEISRGLMPLTVEQTAGLDRLQANGEIGGYTLVADGGRVVTFEGDGLIGPGIMRFQPLLHSDRTGRTTQLHASLGVDPAAYPLAGTVSLKNGGTLAQALATDHSIVITADVANRMGLGVDDTIRLVGQPGVAPLELNVTGIITSFPGNSSSTALYSLTTARQLAGRTDIATHALVLDGAAGKAQSRLEADGWNVVLPETRRESDRAGATMVNLLFKGAGMLGLVIGSFGVLNTLQVLLARRTMEIAMLKTLGYRRRDLLALFGIETALLGLAGAVLGGVAAILPSMIVTTFFSRVAPFLVVWHVDLWVFGSGMLGGFAATMASGVYVIVRASDVRPVVLLRDLPGSRTPGRQLQTLALGLMMLAVFGSISSVTLGSPIAGIGAMIVILVAMSLLSLVLLMLLSAIVRLPLPGDQLWGLARRNLHRQRRRAVSALIALFLGVFAIGLSASAIVGANKQTESTRDQTSSDMVVIYNQGVNQQAIEQIRQHGLEVERTITETPIETRTEDGVMLSWSAVLQGHAEQPPVALTGAAWGSDPDDGVYLPNAGALLTKDRSGRSIQVGSMLMVNVNGQQQHVRVAGFYQQPFAMDIAAPTQGMVVSQALAQKLVGVPATAIVVGKMSAKNRNEVNAVLKHTSSSPTLLTVDDIKGRSQQVAGNFFWLAVSVAGLALVAGAVLIANAVGLAMLERRREIGIFKAIGFSTEHVLRTVLIEHGLLGLLGGGLGVAAVATVVSFYNSSWPAAAISLEPHVALALVALAMMITLGSATLAAWHPTRVRPMGVLREE